MNTRRSALATVSLFGSVLALAALGTTATGCAGPVVEPVGSTAAEATSSSDAPILAVDAATNALESALAKDSVFDGRLGVELATLRPLLTDEELVAYPRAYAELDAVSKAEREVGNAAFALRTKLDELMKEPSKALHGTHIAVMKNGTLVDNVSFGPKELYASFKLLAGTSEGDAAAAFADRLLSHEPQLKAVWSKHTDEEIMSELGRPGLLKAMAKAIASDAKNPVDEVTQAVGGSSKAFDGLLNTLKLLGTSEEKEAISRLGAKAAPLGIALAVFQLGRDANDAHWNAVLVDLLSLPGAAAAGVEFATALDVVSMSSRVLQLGKLAGGLGVLIQTITLLDSLDEWNKSPGAKLVIVGNTVGALAGVLGLVGVASAGPIGAVIVLATGLIGPMMDQAREDGRQNKDKEAVLLAMGWKPAHARAVARAQGRFISTLTKTCGLDRAASLEIIDLVPELAHGDLTDTGVLVSSAPITLEGLATMQHVFARDAARGYLSAAMGSESDPKRRASRLEAALAVADWRGLYNAPIFTTTMTPSAHKHQFAIAVQHGKDVAESAARPALDAVGAYVASLPTP